MGKRLTTLSLLFKVISNLTNEARIEGPLNSKKISNYYLLNTEEDGEELRPKLILTKGDKETN